MVAGGDEGEREKKGTRLHREKSCYAAGAHGHGLSLNRPECTLIPPKFLLPSQVPSIPYETRFSSPTPLLIMICEEWEDLHLKFAIKLPGTGLEWKLPFNGWRGQSCVAV